MQRPIGTRSTQLRPQIRSVGIARTWKNLLCSFGVGESAMAVDLRNRSYQNSSVLDCFPTAIEVTRRPLGGPAEQVYWIVGDITDVELDSHAYDVWHDRRFPFPHIRRAACRVRQKGSARRQDRRPRHCWYVWIRRSDEMQRTRCGQARCRILA